MLLTRQLWRSRIDDKDLPPLTDRTRVVDGMTERSLGANARHRVSGTTRGAEGGATIAGNATGGRGTTDVSAAAATAEVTDKF